MNKNDVPQCIKTIESMWSCHGDFTDKKIAEEDLDLIIGAGVRAASASAQQSYSVIVLDKAEVMRELTGYAGSHALVFCADGTRLDGAAKYLGLEHSEEFNLNSFVTWSTDALLAAQNCALAAASLNIDTLFTNGTMRRDLDMVYRVLNLPQRGCFPLITLILGYASHKPARLRGRLSGEGVVHRNKYRPLDAAAVERMIAAYDDERSSLAMSRAFVEKGCAHYLEWFFKEWLGSFPSSETDPVETRLRNSGFLG